MKVLLSWLNEFADFYGLADSIDAVVEKVVAAANGLGLVVEGVERVGEGLDGVVAVKVVEIHSIEGADRIRRIMVDGGSGSLEQIVCGAFNFQEGDFVPLARPGVTLPGNFAIAKRKMRGVESNGMLCSARELGLGSDYDGLLILKSEGIAPGDDLASTLGIDSDVIIDLAIEANRPDANCHMGVARELAVFFGIDFKFPEISDLSTIERRELPSEYLVEGANSLRLAKFDLSKVVRDRKIANRLELAGMRSISPSVDISNYLMLEIGQPTHPFDGDKVKGGRVRVRVASSGEELQTLDGQVRKLKGASDSIDGSYDLVIADPDGTLLSIAGVMGGQSSEIDDSSTSMLLEVASFRPDLIAKTSKRLGLRSEASHRFERGVDLAICEFAIGRFSYLAGTDPLYIEVVEREVPRIEVTLPRSYVAERLGMEIDLDQVSSKLRRLGFEISYDETTMRVTPPTNRPDVKIAADVVEEFARTFGYQNITRQKLTNDRVGRISPKQRRRREIIGYMVARGFYEAWTSTLLAPNDMAKMGDSTEAIRVKNPMTVEESTLRRSLSVGLAKALISNQNRREDVIHLFEVGKVFSMPVAGELLPRESERFGALFLLAEETSPFAIYRDLAEYFGFFDAISLSRASDSEALLEAGFIGVHPGRSLVMRSGDSVVGFVGELNRFAIEDLTGVLPNGRVGYIEFDLEATAYRQADLRRPITPSIYPAADFDLSFEVASDQLAIELENLIVRSISGYNPTVALIDSYTGDSIKVLARSLTFRVQVVSMDHTLTEAEIRSARLNAIEAIHQSGLGKLRE
ncbi:MAG: phenylalanine--tRNA ligase subunit beta [Actinomycetota bacterium]|nr:phenylalanine--tRNA ligase subunit beta [Actinomycetota bacterium]